MFPTLAGDFQHPNGDSTDQTVYHSLNYAGFSVVAIKAIEEHSRSK
ncbi:MAG: hypothetical protein ABIP30_00185 [Ferruginibacter sp.]